jgi:ABC-type spermidine/putrescine transport system permease subunit I
VSNLIVFFRRQPLLLSLLLVLAGLANTLAFAPYQLHFLPLLTLALLSFALFIATSPRQAALFGFAYGLGWFGLGPVSLLNSPTGTIIGYLTLSFPLVVILQTISLASIDKTLIEAAHNLGCSALRTVFSVIIPAAKVGLIVAALFCFILSFGDFVSPYYLGGSKPPTLSIMIVDSTKSGQQWPRAAVIAVVMILTLLTVAFASVTAAYRRRG